MLARDGISCTACHRMVLGEKANAAAAGTPENACVAERQGHSPQVLAKHYSKARRSADRRAAEHLDRLITTPAATNEQKGPAL